MPQTGTKQQNANANLHAIVDQVDAAEFVMMNDDFFAMLPDPPLARVHLGPLDEFAAGHPNSRYGRALRRTSALLKANGVPAPLAYETHTPMVMRRDHLAEALALRGSDVHLHERTIVGNLHGPKGRRIEVDPKVYGPADPVPAGPYLSTCDASFRGGSRTGRHLRSAFPDRCRYEHPREV